MSTITLTEAARRLNVSAKTMRHYIDTGQVEATLNKEHMPYFYEITEASVEALAAHIAAREKKVKAHTVVESVEALVARVEALENTLALYAFKKLQEAIAKLEARVETLETQGVFAPRAISIKEAPAGVEYYEARAPQSLGSDLVAVANFAELHGIPQTTIEKAMSSNRLPFIRGSWRKPSSKGHITRALDANGRHVFFLLYSQSGRFRFCKECPHDLPVDNKS